MKFWPLIWTCLTIIPGLAAEDRLVSFEEIRYSSGSDAATITNGYAGLYWRRFAAQNVGGLPAESGNRRGLVTGQSIAYAYDYAPSLAASWPFSLKSLWVTPMISTQRLWFSITAYRGTNYWQKYFEITNKTFLQLDLTNITLVNFYESEGRMILDDLLITPPEKETIQPSTNLFKLGTVFFPLDAGSSVVSADFNGDQRNDLALVSQSGTQVLLGSAQGKLETLGTSSGGTFATSGDYNGDGHEDIILSDSSARYVSVIHDPDGVRIWKLMSESVNSYNTGIGPIDAGYFSPTVRAASGQKYDSTDIAVADFDRDGRLDTVLAKINPARLLFSRNTSGYYGPFTPARTNTLATKIPIALRAHDFDRDGDADVAVIYENDSELGILRNDGNFVFTNWTYHATGMQRPAAIAIGDLNGDGLDDLVFRGFAHEVNISFGAPGAQFGPPINILAPGPWNTARITRPLAVNDLNGDGRPDIAVVRGMEIVTLLNMASPPIAIRKVSDLFEIRWLGRFAPGAIVESAASLDGVWQTHPFSPVRQDDGLAVYDSGRVEARFFRLRAP